MRIGSSHQLRQIQVVNLIVCVNCRFWVCIIVQLRSQTYKIGYQKASSHSVETVANLPSDILPLNSHYFTLQQKIWFMFIWFPISAISHTIIWSWLATELAFLSAFRSRSDHESSKWLKARSRKRLRFLFFSLMCCFVLYYFSSFSGKCRTNGRRLLDIRMVTSPIKAIVAKSAKRPWQCQLLNLTHFDKTEKQKKCRCIVGWERVW